MYAPRTLSSWASGDRWRLGRRAVAMASFPSASLFGIPVRVHGTPLSHSPRQRYLQGRIVHLRRRCRCCSLASWPLEACTLRTVRALCVLFGDHLLAAAASAVDCKELMPVQVTAAAFMTPFQSLVLPSNRLYCPLCVNMNIPQLCSAQRPFPLV